MTTERTIKRDQEKTKRDLAAHRALRFFRFCFCHLNTPNRRG